MSTKREYGSQNGVSRSSRKSGSVDERYDAAFRGYINLNLSDDEKKLFEKWAESASLWDVLQASVADGVQLSIKLDPKGSGYLASATQRRVSSVNAGLVVTARAGDAWKALARCLYQLAYLSRAERWEDLQPIANPDRW